MNKKTIRISDLIAKRDILESVTISQTKDWTHYEVDYFFKRNGKRSKRTGTTIYVVVDVPMQEDNCHYDKSQIYTHYDHADIDPNSTFYINLYTNKK